MRIFDVQRTGYTPRIRIINLVDILMILLLFFIATTTFRVEAPAAVKLKLPEAKTAEEFGKQKLDRLLLSIGADERVFLNETPVTLAGLEQAFREAKQRNPDVVLQLSADRSVSYGTVVAVVDAARAAGVRDITAFTKKSVK
jgi:biopolymer transport protein ExbD